VPALQIDTGILTFFALGRNEAPREISFGEGVSGFVKGWARPVDVGGGLEVAGSRNGRVEEKRRGNWE
jgi:hypothetical protein